MTPNDGTETPPYRWSCAAAVALVAVLGACGDRTPSAEGTGLFVRVTDPANAPVANAIVTTDPGSESLATDALGSVFFPSLSAGVYAVTAYHPGLGSARRAVMVGVAGVAELTLVLPGTGGHAGGDAAVGAGGPTPDAGAPRGTFERATCPHAAVLGSRAECGFVAVPESRGAPGGGRTLRIAVAVLKAGGGPARADPVVYLEGGPGAAPIRARLASFADLRSPLAAITAERDLVLVDQRGTGLSQPPLSCVATMAAMDPAPGAEPMMMTRDLTPEQRRALAECREQLVAGGADLAGYNTAYNADDIEDVRRALGYGPWNLLGVSYGTRLALEVARRHPGGVRSVVLDSTLPPQVDLIAEHAGHVERSLMRVMAACEAQSTCRQSYPGLARTLEDLLRRLGAAPPRLAVPGGGPVTLTGPLFMDLLKMMLYSREAIQAVPAVVLATSRGNYDPVRLFLSHVSTADQGLSLAMHMSVMCADEVAFSSREAVTGAAALLDPAFRPHLVSTSYFTSCAIWNVPASPASANQPVVSDVPALVLAGEFDPVTPPAWGELAASTLSRAHSFVFRGESHGLFPTSCGASLVAAFVADPAARPSGACLGALRDPVFIPPFR